MMIKPISLKEARKRARANVARLKSMTEEEIMRTSPPELANLPPDFFKDAVLVFPNRKRAISLRVDEDVLNWFRARGPRYQSRMNLVLRAFMSAEQGKHTHVRKVSEPARRRPGK